MTMTEYETAQLALPQQQVDATKENTAALGRLGTPQAATHENVMQRQEAALAGRKGGPPIEVREFTGTARVVDRESLEAIEVRITARVAWRPEGKGPAGTRIFEVHDDGAPCVAFLEAEWTKRNTELLRD